MNITVLIPTYRRPNDLVHCLNALKKQTRQADEVFVIVRDSDKETWEFLETFNIEYLPLRTATVSVTGVVAALNLGLDQANGDLITITDDDAVPYSDWLARIETHFVLDDSIGGVGGRDWLYHGMELEEGEKKVVGKLQWFGRVIGNHHLGIGKPREVDVLKGVNMSYRRSAINGMHFDKRMLGTGAQVHFELAFGLTLKRAGWKLIYDPMIAVDHYRAQRFDEDQRNKFNPIAFRNMVHNETLALLEHFSPVRRSIFLFWALFIGTREGLGFVQWFRFVFKNRFLAGQKLFASLQGRWLAWNTWQQTKKAKNNF
jgi:glycosyltransferase involved in cell wall biosynthesis